MWHELLRTCPHVIITRYHNLICAHNFLCLWLYPSTIVWPMPMWSNLHTSPPKVSSTSFRNGAPTKSEELMFSRSNCMHSHSLEWNVPLMQCWPRILYLKVQHAASTWYPPCMCVSPSFLYICSRPHPSLPSQYKPQKAGLGGLRTKPVYLVLQSTEQLWLLLANIDKHNIYIYEYGYCGSSWATLLLLSEIPYMVLCVPFNLLAKLWLVRQKLINLELIEENRRGIPDYTTTKPQTTLSQNVNEIKN